jgi:hypothetical protein
MVVSVASRMRQALARSSLYSNVVGDSMLARLRNSTIGLLGAVTAVGLALVAFIVQLGIPGAFDGALPDAPRGVAAVGKAIALTPRVATGHLVLAPGRRSAHIRSSARIQKPSAGARGPGSGVGPDLDSSNQASHAQPPAGQAPEEHAQSPATSTPAPEPTAEQAPATEATPLSAASAKPESQPEPSPEKTKSSGHSRGKAKGQADAPTDSPSSGGSKGHRSGSGHHSYAPPKSSYGSVGNKSPEPDSAPPKLSGPPPSSEPGEEKSPEAGVEEPGHAGKSHKPYH